MQHYTFAAIIATTIFFVAAPFCVLAQPNVGGCEIFPNDFEYNKPITDAEVDPLSNCYIEQLANNADSGNGPYIRLDMGNVLENGYGIPWSSGSTGPVLPLDLNNGYAGESDCFSADGSQLLRPCCADACTGVWLAPYDTPIESQTTANPNPSSGDRHTAYIDTDTCMLYETFATHRTTGPNGWTVVSSAVFNLSSSDFPQRPPGWTSADAAGLPIFPGLLRYEEVSAGEITHALRFTAEISQKAYVLPAGHLGTSEDPYNLPYGIRLRLKADFNESAYTTQGQVLLRALKKYGMFYADQGSGFYISGTSDVNWSNDFFDEINQDGPGRRIHISNFEVIKPPTEITYGYDAGSPSCDAGDGVDGGDGGGGAASRVTTAIYDAINALFM